MDFDILVGTQTGDGYPLRVLRSEGGEASGMLTLPSDPATLQARGAALVTPRSNRGPTSRKIVPGSSPDVAHVDHTPESAKELGRALFDSLLGGALARSYRLSRDRATRAGHGLRLRLRMEDPELAALPWELLYDEEEGDYLALSSKTPVVRYLEVDRPTDPIVAGRPLKILGMTALPTDVAYLDAAAERGRVEAELSPLADRGLATLTWLDGQTWRDLQRAIRRDEWNVLHFIGHGSEGALMLADEDGRSAPLASGELGRMLAGQSSLGLVVLNACEGAKGGGADGFSSLAATLVRRGIPAVVAMQYEVSDSAAITFARDFYAALADGLPVDASVGEARKAASIERPDTVEWATPVLFMRAPDGRLFHSSADAPSRGREVEDDFPDIPGTKGWGFVGPAIVVALIAYVVFLVLSR